MSSLNNRQWERFCVEYFGGKTKKESAIEAGYSPKTAQQIASRLLRKVNILERLQELQQAAASAKIASVRERKQRLTEILRATILDYMSEDGIKVSKDSPNVGAVSEITTKTKVFRKGGEPVNITNLKLHSPIQAIAELNKMEHIYEVVPPSFQDNRVVNIFVVDKETKGLIAQVKERTGKLIEGHSEELPEGKED